MRGGEDKELLTKIVPILASDNEILDADSVQMVVRDGDLVVEGSIIRLDERTAMASAAAGLPPRELRPRTVIAVVTVDL
jgi:hypothetical protein